MTAPPTLREYDISAQSTTVFGRVMCSARDHHWIIDGPVQNGCPGEEVTPAEAFLAAVAACGVELMHVIAKDEGFALDRVSVRIHGEVDRGRQPHEDRTVFTAVRVDVDLSGINQANAAQVVKGFTRRCPLFGSLWTACPALEIVHKVV